MLKEQDVAPDFELLDDTGKPTKLSDFRGKKSCLLLPQSYDRWLNDPSPGNP